MMTLPNILSAFRIVAVVAIAAVLLVPAGEARAVALVLFAVAAVTDWLDGWIARTFHMTSDLGRVLDIIADKLLVGVTLLMLCAVGTIGGVHALAAALILAREIGISGLREHLAAKEIVIPASLAGKWKTSVQLVALAVLIGAPLAPDAEEPAVMILGQVFLWTAAVLTVWSGAQYAWGSRGAWGKT
jgi:CDP-diacylglycerol--glycerol-3-phosphate 3-phosphatidyltransferase